MIPPPRIVTTRGVPSWVRNDDVARVAEEIDLLSLAERTAQGRSLTTTVPTSTTQPSRNDAAQRLLPPADVHAQRLALSEVWGLF